MALYLLSYDLHEPNFDYQSFYDALNAMEAKHIQDSVWGVRTTSSAEVVYKYLWTYVQPKKSSFRGHVRPDPELSSDQLHQ
jgi:hypothetical protein